MNSGAKCKCARRGLTLRCGNALAPSPLYSGERAGVRGHISEQRNSTHYATRPSPQPSPPSTGEREPEIAVA